MGDHLKTFSAVFDGDPIDERRYIEVVLKATGAESHLVHPSAEKFLEEVGEGRILAALKDAVVEFSASRTGHSHALRPLRHQEFP